MRQSKFNEILEQLPCFPQQVLEIWTICAKIKCLFYIKEKKPASQVTDTELEAIAKLTTGPDISEIDDQNQQMHYYLIVIVLVAVVATTLYFVGTS